MSENQDESHLPELEIKPTSEKSSARPHPPSEPNSFVKTPRLRNSPLLLPPFQPHKIAPPVYLSARNQKPEPLPPGEPLYTPFKNSPYRRPQEQELNYVKRSSMYRVRDQNYKREYANRYKKEHPLPWYQEDNVSKWKASLEKSRKIQEMKAEMQRTQKAQTKSQAKGHLTSETNAMAANLVNC